MTPWDFDSYTLPWGVVLLTSLAGAVTDLHARRVPNLLTFPVLLGGLLWATYAQEAELRRRTSRHTSTVLARATLLGDTAGMQFSVKTFNVSPGGVGLITRIPLRQSADLELVPVDGRGMPVRVRVVHCTRALQGYKVGCELVSG